MARRCFRWHRRTVRHQHVWDGVISIGISARHQRGGRRAGGAAASAAAWADIDGEEKVIERKIKTPIHFRHTADCSSTAMPFDIMAQRCRWRAHLFNITGISRQPFTQRHAWRFIAAACCLCALLRALSTCSKRTACCNAHTARRALRTTLHRCTTAHRLHRLPR